MTLTYTDVQKVATQWVLTLPMVVLYLSYDLISISNWRGQLLP